MVILAVQLLREFTILFARVAAVHIVSTIPTQSKSIACLGGPQQLVNLLRLPSFEVSSMLTIYDVGRAKKSELQKRLAKSMAALLKYEALQTMANPSSTSDKTPDKSGHLKKQGKLLGVWKQKYFVLQGHYLSWFKDEKGSQPLGMLDLAHDMVAIGTSSFKKDSSTFQLVTNHRTILFKAPNPKDKAEWIQKIADAQISSIGKQPRFSNSSLSTLLTKEIAFHFSETVNANLGEVLEEQSSHPHGSNRVIKFFRIESKSKNGRNLFFKLTFVFRYRKSVDHF